MTETVRLKVEFALKEYASEHLGGFRNGWLDVEEYGIPGERIVKLFTNIGEGRERIMKVYVDDWEVVI